MTPIIAGRHLARTGCVVGWERATSPCDPGLACAAAIVCRARASRPRRCLGVGVPLNAVASLFMMRGVYCPRRLRQSPRTLARLAAGGVEKGVRAVVVAPPLYYGGGGRMHPLNSADILLLCETRRLLLRLRASVHADGDTSSFFSPLPPLLSAPRRSRIAPTVGFVVVVIVSLCAGRGREPLSSLCSSRIVGEWAVPARHVSAGQVRPAGHASGQSSTATGLPPAFLWASTALEGSLCILFTR